MTYRVVVEQTGMAFDFPSKRAFDEADRWVSDTDRGAAESRQTIYDFCKKRGVEVHDEQGNLRRDWPERAAHCYAWSTIGYRPEVVTLGERGGHLRIGGNTLPIFDGDGNTETPEAVALARLFATAPALEAAARAVLNGDRKGKAQLAAALKMLDAPAPRPVSELGPKDRVDRTF